MTSHDVIHRLRKITGVKKIGHAGTLDPNATGLLIVGIGRESTRKLGEIAKNTKKEYLAEIYLGERRDTDDVEGEIIPPQVVAPQRSKSGRDDSIGIDSLPMLSKIKIVINKFRGEIEQVPPIYSAIKIKGKKAYELARRGQKVDLKPRKIIVYSNEVVSYEPPVLKVKFIVSSGTYIRALARDIGEKLGVGAYLANLRRTKIGKLDVKKAVELDELSADNWEQFIIKI